MERQSYILTSRSFLIVKTASSCFKRDRFKQALLTLVRLHNLAANLRMIHLSKAISQAYLN